MPEDASPQQRVVLAALCVSPGLPIREAIQAIDNNSQGIVLVVDDQRRLIGTVTDGDVRRAILAGIDLQQPLTILLANERRVIQRGPITAPAETRPADLLHRMTTHGVRHIPLLDGAGRVMDVALLSEMVKEYELPLTAVVMAGGFGMRIRPLTETVPKPMLPVGDRPLLELMIAQLQQAGIKRVSVTTHYKGDVINQHFGDGSRFGVDIRYIHEDDPLGTAGALSLLEGAAEPLLIINGDILTSVDFRAMLDFHTEHEADMTVAVREHGLQVPYGVVETGADARVIGIVEKPEMRHFINAGIYLVNPDVCQWIPSGEASDMPDLITRLVAAQRPIVAFPIRESWFDIGTHEDYARAQDHMSGEQVPSVS